MSPFGRAARTLRTVRHLLPRQLVAQLRHAALGVPAPVSRGAPPPPLSVDPADAAGLLAPFAPPPRLDRIEWDGDGPTFLLLNRCVHCDGDVDWDAAPEGPLFAYHQHQFDYLRRDDVDPALRRRLILDWIARHPRGCGWDPHPISLRILAWGRLLLSPGALALDEADDARVRASLADQIETLSRGLETRLQANHLFSNLVGVVFGGLLFDGPRADGWRARWPALRTEIARQIGPDGMHEERSPMYHGLLLEQVLDLANLARCAPHRAPDDLAGVLGAAAERMLGALDVLTHPDGEIALFCDAGFGAAPPPAELRRYASDLGLSARAPASPGWLPDAGYARLESGEFALFASVAGPAPAHQPGHAHCDALSFELSLGRERVVADTGVFEYVAGPRRETSRATASHATIEVGGREQSEIWSAHRVGGRARVAVAACEAGRRVEATCAGFATRDTIHRRAFEVGDGRVVVDDRLEGRARPVRVVLPLAPGVDARLAGDAGAAQRLELATRAGRRVTVELPAPGDLTWRLREMPYFPELGRQEMRPGLVGESRAFRAGRWVFRTSD